MMDGRNTPARALTQMTKRQKATESGTPANPLRDSVNDSVRVTASVVGGIEAPGLYVPGAFEMSHFRSSAAGIAGVGFGSRPFSFAHGQDRIPSQQQTPCAWVAHGFAGAAARHDWTWENWITSPRNSATIDLMSIAVVRVMFCQDIPRFIVAWGRVPGSVPGAFHQVPV